MGAEHSQQRLGAESHDILMGRDGRINNAQMPSAGDSAALTAAALAASKRRSQSKQHQNNTNNSGINGGNNMIINSTVVIASKQIMAETASPTSSELSRPPSPPLSICSDLPYVSYTDRPIGDSPKIRNKGQSTFQHGNSRSAAIAAARKSYPSGTKPKRPQSTASSHSIVIVKPGVRDNDYDTDPDLARLRNIPQFLPVLRESITSATFTRDPEILDRLQSQHFINICSRMQTHLNICATHIATEQDNLVERTKIVSNSITTLFASFVDMQKTYAAYAEQFAKIRSVSEQLNSCNALLYENIASLEVINNFLDDEDRLEPFVWRTDDNKLRGQAEGAAGGNSNRLWRM